MDIGLILIIVVILFLLALGLLNALFGIFNPRKQKRSGGDKNLTLKDAALYGLAAKGAWDILKKIKGSRQDPK